MNVPYRLARLGLCIVGAVLWAQPVVRSEGGPPPAILSADLTPFGGEFFVPSHGRGFKDGEHALLGVRPSAAFPDSDGGGFEDEHRITLGSPCPLTTCIDDRCILTQSQDTKTDGENQIACADSSGNTTENAWARCYDLANEGVPNGGPLTIDSITFGVQEATRDGIRVDVILYLDIDGCPPDAPGVDGIELCRKSIEVNIADEGTMIIVPFPEGPVVPAGTDLIVEIASVDDGLELPFFAFRTMGNQSGQCGPSYLRAEQCGIPGWYDLNHGFPGPHLIQILSGTVGGLAAECGNSEVEGCEGCDPPDGLHCDEFCRWVCGDGVVQETEECDPPDEIICDTDCTLLPRWICGDGVVEGPEECDPPDGMVCDTNCTLLPTGACCNFDGQGGCAELAEGVCAAVDGNYLGHGTKCSEGPPPTCGVPVLINVPADFSTIQGAIDAAADGDEIVVAPGTYNETINFLGKAVTVHSSDGPEVTTIDAEGSGTVVTCDTDEGLDTVLEGFTITGGNALSGGGMYNFSSSPTVSNCTFNGNSAISKGGGMYNLLSSPTVSDCRFNDNTAERGGGVFSDSGSPTVTNCIFSGNSATEVGAGMYNASSSSTVTNCTFNKNSATLNAGGMYNSGASSTVSNCVFSGNSAGSGGGGMHNNNSSPTVTNCVFTGNTSSFGGGIRFQSLNHTTITNCTFTENMSSVGSAIYAGELSDPTVSNSILWGNSSPQISDKGFGIVAVRYSDVEGGWPGIGNIDSDPLFVDPATGNLRLLAVSPCIDAADSTAVPAGIVTDLDGNPRFVDVTCVKDSGNPGGAGQPVVDMGTYENQFEFVDCNANGETDICDITKGTSADCNNNSIPDECIELENDCNSNAIPDECDIADGTSEDCSFITHDCCESDHGPGCNDPNIETCVCAVAPSCCEVDWAQGCVKVVEILGCGSCGLNNGNGMPDECEPDCNQNGQADSCDIVQGTSNDDDGDGIPDECQSPADLNGDGVVNAVDLAILLAAWGPCPDPDDCPADLNGDGTVGPTDLAQLLGSWGPL